jgi:hypothetical protein
VSNRSAEPDWYVPGDVATSVRRARSANVTQDSLVERIGDHEFEDLPQERVEAIVTGIPQGETDTEGGETIPQSQPQATDAEPRQRVPRRFSVSDLGLLSPREAARVFGIALEAFEGNTVRPAATHSGPCDIYWNRQHATVGLRIVPTATVGPEHVKVLVNGDIDPDATRTPTDLAIVTSGTYEERTTELADEHDIECLGRGHVEALLRRVRITPEAVGQALEDGEDHDGPLLDLVDVAPVPEPRQTDPLTVDSVIDTAAYPEGSTDVPDIGGDPPDDGLGGGTGPGTGSGSSDSMGNTADGETGTLYADPTEDGDYEAFDRFVDDVTSMADDAGVNASEVPESSQNDGSLNEPSTTDQEETDTGDSRSKRTTSGTDDEATDLSRGELLFDLIDAKTEAGEPMTAEDISAHGSYELSAYVEEFGSVEAALGEANIEFEEDRA